MEATSINVLIVLAKEVEVSTVRKDHYLFAFGSLSW